MKLNIGHFILIFLCSLQHLSCSKKVQEKTTEELFRQWERKEVFFPSAPIFAIHGKNEISYKIPSTEYKIIHYIDSTNYISYKEQLNEWNEFIEKLNKMSKGEVSCLFFLHFSQERELKIALKEGNFNLPVFLDESNEFNRLNKFPTHKSFQTILLNKENRMIAIGNPISNPKIKELYLNLISGNNLDEKIVYTKAKINTKLIDFGSFNWRQKQDTIFTLTNKGNQPLIIYKIITSCGCTTSHYDPRPIAFGDSVNIQVSFKAEHPENFSKTILLHCNTANSPFVLHIKGKALSHL